MVCKMKVNKFVTQDYQNHVNIFLHIPSFFRGFGCSCVGVPEGRYRTPCQQSQGKAESALLQERDDELKIAS